MAKGITENDVHAAADAVLARGERPTVERIRAHLGTGSPNTVTRWLETWWQQLGGRLAAQQARLALPAAPESVVRLATQWWEQALVAARGEAEQTLAEDRARLDATRRELADEARAWQAQVHQHAAVAEQAGQLLAAAQQRLADVQRTCDTQAEQLRDLGAQRSALQARSDRQEAELLELQRLAGQRETALAAEREGQAQHLRALEDRAHAEVDRARQETKVLRTDLTGRVQRLEAELQAGREREAVAQQALAQAQQAAAIERTRADLLERQRPAPAGKAAPRRTGRTAPPRSPRKRKSTA